MVSEITGDNVSTSAPQPENSWRQRYARRLYWTDFLVLAWVIFGVQIAWFGVDSNDVSLQNRFGNVGISYTIISVVLLLAWMAVLSVYGTRAPRAIGAGSQEYRLIANASFRLFGLVAIAAFLLKIDLARGYVLIAFPLGTVTLIFARWMWRQWLDVQRSRGGYSSRVLLVGSSASVVQTAFELGRQKQAGYLVVGACIPARSGDGPLKQAGIQVFGEIDDALGAMAVSGADTLIITSSDDLPPQRVREISWGLEPGRQHLVVAPSLIDIGGPRIHARPVAGLPLIHVETPRYEGGKRWTKRAFDIAASGAGILLLSPVLAVIAIVVRLSTPGPVLFRQERIGHNGRQFRMLKFRSMVIDAEARLGALQGISRDAGNQVLFKLKDDPRITPIGAFLRRFSLDELPQLFNVFGGSMSLVGPRPPLQREVDLYDTHVHRRFLVKPGITGLWQVSGRSNLSWEDTVRLDLYYVENWSLTGDLIILARTLRTVIAKDGAY